MKATIVLLPGDGVGPEIVSAAKLVLDRVVQTNGHEFAYEEQLIGGIAIDETGDPLPADTRAAFERADAVLLGAVGGPKWDDPKATVRPRAGAACHAQVTWALCESSSGHGVRGAARQLAAST